MNNPFDMISVYSSKALENLNALNDLNTATVDAFVDKQIALTNSLLDASLAGSKALAAVKSPVEAVEVSSKLAESVGAKLTDFVKESSASSLATGESVKAILEQSVALNQELAGKIFDSGVEQVKKTTRKKASK